MDAADPSQTPEPTTPDQGRIGAVVLAGGTATRLGGSDKASIELDGVTLLERSLAATMTAVEVVVVGDQVPTTRPVTWTVEDPRGGGPAAGLLAALSCFLRAPDWVQVLAVDMPRVTPSTFARLAEAILGEGTHRDQPLLDGAVLLDDTGRRQPLCALFRSAGLQAAAPTQREDWHGLALHRLLEPLRLLEVPAHQGEERDIDTWEDLRRERACHDRAGSGGLRGESPRLDR